MSKPQLRFFISLAALFLTANYSGAQSKTTTYTYDALGRLTYVEDSQNGNRDYDYDKAGNRLNVAVGTANDGASEPASLVPALPTNLTKSYVNDCAWRTTWTLSPGAVNYSYKNTLNQIITIYPTTSYSGPTVELNGNTITVTTTCPSGQPEANEPASVKACNGDGCSAAASF